MTIFVKSHYWLPGWIDKYTYMSWFLNNCIDSSIVTPKMLGLTTCIKSKQNNHIKHCQHEKKIKK